MGCNFTAKIDTVSDESEKVYYIKDHLGSVRVAVDAAGDITSAKDYFAYGELLREYNYANPSERYKFTGKERDTETDYDYFGARYYDSELGLWPSSDPLAILRPGLSPYNYCQNNPTNRIDPNGMWDEEKVSDNIGNWWWNKEMGFMEYKDVEITFSNSNRISRIPVRNFSVDYEAVKENPWGYSGQFYAYANSINTYEYNAILDGRDSYTQEDIEDVDKASMETFLFITPLKINFVKAAAKITNLSKVKIYKLPNVKGYEIRLSKDFRAGWHKLPNGKTLPHYHRRPGISKHRPWEGGW